MRSEAELGTEQRQPGIPPEEPRFWPDPTSQSPEDCAADETGMESFPASDPPASW